MTPATSAPSAAGFRHSQVAVDDSSVHVVQTGDPDAPPFVFLHGWPESWRAWQDVMVAASLKVRAISIDLPGIGKSTGEPTDGSKRQLAAVVHRLISDLGLNDVTLVGHDIGGMVVYSYLRAYQGISRAVIMNVGVPGVGLWEETLHNPHVWHFGFHATPGLPEQLVQGRQEVYFDHFFDLISADPAKITPAARAAHITAYATNDALTAGFNWYRAFGRDAADNEQSANGPQTTTPLLYLRGEHEGGDIAAAVQGFETAGVTDVGYGLVPDTGHFAPEEAPDETWRLISDFADRQESTMAAAHDVIRVGHRAGGVRL